MSGHSHAWPYEDRASQKCIEIGEHHCLRSTVHGGDPSIRNGDGSIAGGPEQHLAGFIIAHDAPDLDVRCEGALNIDAHCGEKRWQMTGSLKGSDLTLSPSVLCTRDGDHGYVRDGKWVPA